MGILKLFIQRKERRKDKMRNNQLDNSASSSWLFIVITILIIVYLNMIMNDYMKLMKILFMPLLNMDNRRLYFHCF